MNATKDGRSHRDLPSNLLCDASHFAWLLSLAVRYPPHTVADMQYPLATISHLTPFQGDTPAGRGHRAGVMGCYKTMGCYKVILVCNTFCNTPFSQVRYCFSTEVLQSYIHIKKSSRGVVVKARGLYRKTV